jgi:hypothetical protein
MGGLDSVNEDAIIARSVAIAVKMAQQVDKLVKSDQEWLKKEP